MKIITEGERKRLETIKKYDDFKIKIAKRNREVLELFICGDDNRIRIISETLGISPDTASRIVGEYYEGKIVFEIPNYKILNSSINYTNENQQWNK